MMERYTVLGPDGSEYGPASLDELSAWKRQGRVANDSRIRVMSTGVTLKAADLLGKQLPAPPRLPTPPAKTATTPSWVLPFVVASMLVVCLLPLGSAVFRGADAAQRGIRGSAEYQSSRRVAGALVAISRGEGKIPDLRKTSELLDQLKPYVSADVLKDAGRLEYHDEISGLALSTIDQNATWLFHTRKSGTGRATVCYVNGECRIASDQEVDQLPEAAAPPNRTPTQI